MIPKKSAQRDHLLEQTFSAASIRRSFPQASIWSPDKVRKKRKEIGKRRKLEIKGAGEETDLEERVRNKREGR